MWNNIPVELRALPQWICWQYQQADGRWTKIPISPLTGKMASVTDPETWTSFQAAAEAAKNYSGIGFVLSADDPYCIIDLDNKPDKPCSPEQLARHTKIFETFDSYAEESVSGTGVHIVVRGSLPTGVHRDNVEIYSSSRYMAFTGKVLRDRPIQDYQPLLDILYAEMQPARSSSLQEEDEVHTDSEIVERASNASNGDKFNSLCSGAISEYPSQSEADFALLAIIAFYTRSNEQVRRIFRMTALGKRTKATRNDTYLDFALSKVRAQQPAPVDMNQMAENALALIASAEAKKQPAAKPAPEPSSRDEVEAEEEDYNPLPISVPPGIIGDLARYFYSAAIRPVPEIALAAAITIVAGVAGRSYNISGSGLNQYLILLARTGAGKEGALSGIENLISSIRPRLPMVDQFIGPAAFASGQALVKVLNEKPCFVSVLGEFGLTLQQLSDHRANSAQLMLRKVLLDLYAKSGWNRMLRSSVYSDQEKNTKIIQAPNVTILGESTPETFFEGLDAGHIAEGLIPRFSVIEYTGARPARNRNANQPPSPQLAQAFADLVTVSLTTSANMTCCQVQMDQAALDLLDTFDTKADRIMNQSNQDVELQLWNRAHLKALKLAALIAVGVNAHNPVVTATEAAWAIDFVERDVSLVVARFSTGDVGNGDSKQLHDLKRAVEQYFSNPSKSADAMYGKLRKAGIIPYGFLIKRTANIASFRSDRMGATYTLKKNLQALMDSGLLTEVTRATLAEKHAFSGIAYGILGDWS